MIDISILIAVIGVVLSIATFYFGRQAGAKQDGKVSQRMRTRQWKTLRNVWQIWGLAYNGKVTAEWSLHTSLYFWTRQ